MEILFRILLNKLSNLIKSLKSHYLTVKIILNFNTFSIVFDTKFFHSLSFLTKYVNIIKSEFVKIFKFIYVSIKILFRFMASIMTKLVNSLLKSLLLILNFYLFNKIIIMNFNFFFFNYVFKFIYVNLEKFKLNFYYVLYAINAYKVNNPIEFKFKYILANFPNYVKILKAYFNKFYKQVFKFAYAKLELNGSKLNFFFKYLYDALILNNLKTIYLIINYEFLSVNIELNLFKKIGLLYISSLKNCVVYYLNLCFYQMLEGLKKISFFYIFLLKCKILLLAYFESRHKVVVFIFNSNKLVHLLINKVKIILKKLKEIIIFYSWDVIIYLRYFFINESAWYYSKDKNIDDIKLFYIKVFNYLIYLCLKIYNNFLTKNASIHNWGVLKFWADVIYTYILVFPVKLFDKFVFYLFKFIIKPLKLKKYLNFILYILLCFFIYKLINLLLLNYLFNSYVFLNIYYYVKIFIYFYYNLIFRKNFFSYKVWKLFNWKKRRKFLKRFFFRDKIWIYINNFIGVKFNKLRKRKRKKKVYRKTTVRFKLFWKKNKTLQLIKLLFISYVKWTLLDAELYHCVIL